MLGWLERPCPRFPAHAVATRCLRVDSEALAAWLPRLGSVLYLPARATLTSAAAGAGWLCGAPALVPLVSSPWWRVACTVDACGPREWADCIDPDGRVLARLHLLPDTDYCAWDALPGRSVRAGSRVSARLPLGFDRAHLLALRVRALGGLKLLESTPASVSPLGRRLAHSIAGAQRLVEGEDALRV